MQYREMPNGDKISSLGFGTLRLPLTKSGKVDREKAKEYISLAIEKGVNYFDTAYIYDEGEEVLGEALSAFDRSSYFIASKIPLPTIKQTSDFERIFAEQQKRLNTERIDYFLLHSVTSYEDYERVKGLGFWEFIKGLKEKGLIRCVGFSFHSNVLAFKKMVDDGDWDFCQIQYNYIDEEFQAGTEGLKYAVSKGLGVVVMEPLRGGRLVGLMPNESKELIAGYPVKRSAAEWGIRWVLSHQEVTCALSGMNTIGQIEENIASAESATPGCITEEDQKLINKLKANFEKGQKVPCTGCSYCMPCPNGVDIPTCFALYNNRKIFGGMKPLESYIFYLDGFENPPSRASLCVGCNACLKKCPQGLEIPKLLKQVSKEMEKFYLKYHFRIMRYLSYKYTKVRITQEWLKDS